MPDGGLPFRGEGPGAPVPESKLTPDRENENVPPNGGRSLDAPLRTPGGLGWWGPAVALAEAIERAGATSDRPRGETC